MEKAFLNWVKNISQGETASIAIDGKYSKGTDRTFNRGKKPLLIVSAYSHELGLSLVETEGLLGDERGAAEKCLELLDLNGVLVDADAGIGSVAIAEAIINKKGDYLVPLKANQKLSQAAVNEIFERDIKKAKTATSEDDGHARGERRTCYLLPVKADHQELAKWPNAKVIFAVLRERTEKDNRYVLQETGWDGKQKYRLNENEYRYNEDVVLYISSKNLNAKKALEAVRKHWAIENKVHWVLDVAFREDDCRVRAKVLARQLSLIRKIALNIIRNSNTTGSVKGRMKVAAWNDKFLDSMLFI